MTTKDEARAKVKNFRRILTPDMAAIRSQAIYEKVINLKEYQRAETVYIYKAINNEAGTDLIISNALRTGKTVAFPRVTKDDLIFYRVMDTSELKKGYFGISEPEPDPAKIIDTDKGIMIVPGVAFDRLHNRCGYGKGFYDRFLASHKGIIRVGIAFEAQIFPELENTINDITMNRVITEQNIY